ncbi:putative bifunctional diguanylate cyclase/phosphodiesterase [Methylobacterium nigriterrae]|uniref:putative bifunctional diguanylate cyclase/phosphodiesterase n=1 Tax=Methylobacterium nigriterrae TaxID=3127512 RepID=UPI0030134743
MAAPHQTGPDGPPPRPAPGWPRRVWTRLRGPGPAAEAEPGERERYTLETRFGQLEETLKLANYSALTHVAIAVAVTAFFWDAAPQAYLAGLLAVVTATSALAVAGAWAHRRRRAEMMTEARIGLGYRVSNWIALILGTAWGTMPVVLFAPADSDHRMIVTAIAAGMIADAYVIGPILSVALLFTVPLVAGSFVGLARSGDSIGASLAILLTVYAAFVLFSVRRMSHLSYQRIHDRVRVSDQNETIGLLLHEFEESTSDWLWETDAQGRFDHVSARVAQVAGRRAEDLQGLTLAEVLACGAAGALGSGAAEVVALIESRTAFRDHVVELPFAAGTRWWQLSGKPASDKAGRFTGFRGVGSDITASRDTEARIAFLASYDPLTGLANRALFQDRATAECARVAGSAEACALLYLDLDGFKAVNDTFGHGMGDQLLRSVAGRLQPVSADGLWVFRLGGDEFAVMQRCGGVAEAVALAERLIALVSAPYLIDSVKAEIGVSIGIALTPAHAGTPESLLRKADLALYRAKAKGKGSFFVFEDELEVTQRARRELEADIKLAIERNELALHYQPLTSLRDGCVVCFEALLRWSTPARGPVSPVEFIPVAEATGMIVAIGRHVLGQACREAARWPRHIRVAVNISPIQFRTTGFVDDIAAALATSGLDPDRLEIEITESVFLDKTAITMTNLNELRSMGIRIALDDFGTGYSSLSYLAKFPVDKIKIDRSFVRDINTSDESLAVIEAILAIAQKLSISVTAEGVETTEQAKILKARNCNDIQGYLLSPARPPEDIFPIIERIPQDFKRMLPTDPAQPWPRPVRVVGA